MARPKEFDPERALAGSIEAFREQGFAATSTSSLTRRMGIGRGSLFATFGTKGEIFRAALERYREQDFGSLIAMLDAAPSPRQAIEQIFRGIAERHLKPDPYGCLVVNSTVELAPHDRVVAKQVRKAWSGLEDALCRAIERGQTIGEIGDRQTARALARFFLTVMRGLSVGSKLRPDRQTLDDILGPTLAALD